MSTDCRVFKQDIKFNKNNRMIITMTQVVDNITDSDLIERIMQACEWQIPSEVGFIGELSSEDFNTVANANLEEGLELRVEISY